MKVELITPDRYTDDFVVDCARVSYSKRADQYTPGQNAKLIRYLANPPDGVPHWAPFAGPRICFDLTLSLQEWDWFFSHANLHGFSWHTFGERGSLISRELNGSLWAWAEHSGNLPSVVQDQIRRELRHQFPACAKVLNWDNDAFCPTSRQEGLVYESVPEHPDTIYENLRIRAPIFVARQLGKHQRHLVWSETSRRYVKDEPELYWPKEWHKAPTHSKQGASSERFDDEAMETVKDMTEAQVEVYNDLVSHGLAPEEARMILPQNMMTEWIWTGSLNAFKRVCRERLAPNTQGATREVAAMIDSALAAKHGHRWREGYE